MTLRDRILDLIERWFMPMRWNERKRMTPDIERFQERMQRFRDKNGEPVPVDRGGVLLTAAACVLVAVASMLQAGSGCAETAVPAVAVYPAYTNNAIASLRTRVLARFHEEGS